jgi:hypothetical protein
MDENPNPDENEDPKARLNHFSPSDEKTAPESLIGKTVGGALTSIS